LNRALQSIFLQTYTDWECIIVDDGSTDNTAKQLKCERRNKYFYKENIEFQVRNVGLHEASGDFIQFFRFRWLSWFEKIQIQINDVIQYDISICDYSPFDFTSENSF
jgi:glycosyltransferase involved in cell wall biosynthesis